MAAVPDKFAGSDTALKFGKMALEDFRQERWSEALAGFSQAERVMHSPVFGLFRARCLKNLGHWLEARSQLQGVAGEDVSAQAPAPWAQARETAKAELADLVRNIPEVEIQLDGPSDVQLAVNLDAKPLPLQVVQSSLAASRIQLDPGQHQLTILRDGKAIDLRSFNLASGQQSLTIKLGPYERPPKPTAEARVALPPALRPMSIVAVPPPVPRNESSTVSTSAYVALGFGLFSTCLGTVSGILAWRERNGILENCSGLNCPERYATRLDWARRYGNLSTAAFTAGGVGFATAGLIVFAAPTGSPNRSSLGVEFSGRF